MEVTGREDFDLRILTELYFKLASSMMLTAIRAWPAVRPRRINSLGMPFPWTTRDAAPARSYSRTGLSVRKWQWTVGSRGNSGSRGYARPMVGASVFVIFSWRYLPFSCSLSLFSFSFFLQFVTHVHVCVCMCLLCVCVYLRLIETFTKFGRSLNVRWCDRKNC